MGKATVDEDRMKEAIFVFKKPTLDLDFRKDLDLVLLLATSGYMFKLMTLKW